ncbi:MAG: hypothetical protein STSR0002_13420 [Smithella sp.]|jgi:ABC-type transporter Mla subunit MlaD
MNITELENWLRGVSKEVEENVITGDTKKLQDIIDRINKVRDDEDTVIPATIKKSMAKLKQISAVSQLAIITKSITQLTSEYSEAKKEIAIATKLAAQKNKNLLFPKIAEQSTQFVSVLDALKSAYDNINTTMNNTEKSVYNKLVSSIDALKSLNTEVEKMT